MVVFCISLFSLNYSFGQTFSLKEKIEDTDIIFEGKVLSKKSFWNESHTFIFTSNFVFVDKIYKGSINQPIVEIITLGGELENEMVIAPHAATLSKDKNGLFFCSTKMYDQLNLDRNAYRIKYEEEGIINFPKSEEKKIRVGKEEFTTKNKLSNYIQQQNQQPYREISKKMIWNTFCDNSNSFVSKNELEVFLSFDNPSISISEQFVEFDIMVSCNEEGVELGNADLFINYTSESFGEYIAENNVVEITKGIIIESEKYNLQTIDLNSNTININLETIESGDFGLLTTSKQTLCKVRFNIEGNDALAAISFDEIAIAGNIYYHCNGTFIPFDRIDFSTSLNAVSSSEGEEIGLSYNFERIKIIEGATKFEFYITAESHKPSILTKGELHLKYNINAFGENVVSNNRIKADLPPEYNSSFNIEMRDIKNNMLRITISPKLDLTTSYLPNLEPNLFKSLLKIELDILECKEPVRIQFVPDAMQEKSSRYVDKFPFNQELYNPVYANDGIDINTCECPKPEISGFSPNSIGAGMNEVLTITGDNFGDWDADNSRVIFRNGDDGGFSDAVAEIGDIVSWENKVIEVLVPSVTNGQVWRNPACSGIVKVVNICGEDTTTEELNIPYAVLNRRSIATRPADKIVVREQNSNGFTFEFSQNVSQDKRNAFRDALDEWCTETSIEYKISDTESSLTAASADDGVNLISTEEVTTAGGNAALLLATAYFESCPNPDKNSLGWAMTDLDIKIDPSVGNSMSDFQLIKNRFLHELGHAHMLQHSKRLGVNPIFPQDQYIVFFDLTDIDSHPNNPVAKIEADDSQGANLLFSNSAEVIDETSCGNPIHKGVCGSGTNSTNSIYSYEYLEIYPNPSLGNFSVELKDHDLINSTLNIYSLEGVLVYNKIMNSQSIDINGLSSGIYIIEILKGDISVVNKIVITNE